MRVVIVGAGVAGLSTAFALSVRGVRATVVAPDHGASERGAGIVSAQFDDPGLFALARRSQEIARRLVRVHVCGHAQMATTARGAATLDGLPETREGLPRELESVLATAFRRRIVRAVFRPEDLWLRPTLLLRALGAGSRRVRARAREIREGAVVTDRGVLECDRIVLALGASSFRFAPEFAATRERACLARVRVSIPMMLHVVETGFYARPDGASSALAGDGSLRRIRSEARRVLGSTCVSAGGADIVVARGVQPVLRKLSETTLLFAALGGDGFALGPAMGEVAADLVLGR